MRVLIVDPPGHGLDLAMRAQEAGHEVKLAIKEDDKTNFIGRGLVQVVRDHRPWLRWSQLAVCTDNSLYLHDIARFREEGGTVVGSTPQTAQLELDRQHGQEIFKRA